MTTYLPAGPELAGDSRSPSLHVTGDGGSQLLAALAAQMSELVLAVDRTGRVKGALGGDGGPFGRAAVGARIFDLCHPDDLSEIVQLGLEGLTKGPGWEVSTSARLGSPGGPWRRYDLHALNLLDDPAVAGFVVRLRYVPGADDEPVAVLPGRAAQPGAGTGRPGAAQAHPVGVIVHPGVEARLEDELEMLAGAIPLPILFVDRGGSAYFANDAAKDLCSHLRVQLADEGLAGIVHPEDRPFVEETLQSLAESGGERTLTFRMMPHRPSAEDRVLEATFSAKGGPRQVRGIVVTLVDMTAHHARESELLRMASCDPLTGLLNRAEFEEALAARIQAAPDRVTLLYCDLDGFKSVNDDHGHDVGDELLVEIARILERKTRPGDLVGRLGGDEFAIAVDSPDSGDAQGLACRIAVAIAETSSYRSLPVSASVGAARAKRGDNARDLLKRADAAMYHEKRRRRRPIAAYLEPAP